MRTTTASILASTLVLASCYGTVHRIDGDVGTDADIDTSIDTGADTTTDTGFDTATDTGFDTATDTAIDTSVDPGVDTPPGCLSDEDCLPGYFCELVPGTCDPSIPGTCVAIGDGDCPAIYAPECGCDGVTYGNSCERHHNSMSMQYSGECATGEICAPWLDECAAGYICEVPMGSCDVIGVSGVCQPIRDDCGWLWDPVCSCDGITYANDCERQQADAWIAHWGECGAHCGAPGFPPCPDSAFCEFPTGSCGEWGDGECMTIPFGCPDIWDPVCGCDDHTYGNDCERQSAGVSSSHDGPC